MFIMQKMILKKVEQPIDYIVEENVCVLHNPLPSANGFMSFFIKKLNEGNKGKSLFLYIYYLAP